MTQKRDIIVIGASAGGPSALRTICAALPADLSAAVFIVWHTAPDAFGLLPQMLFPTASLPVAFAQHGEMIVPGRIYIAPPDHHMVLTPDSVELNRGPRQNRFRPAIDPLFRSAARHFNSRVIGVVLTGGLDDGAEGLLFIKRNGGMAVVQDPADAEVPSMPRSALEIVPADYVLKLMEIPEALTRLVNEMPSVGVRSRARKPMPQSNDEEAILRPGNVNGPPTAISCPDCNGALWRSEEDDIVMYRCHVGHGFTEQGMLAAKNEEVELALWTALRVLKEKAAACQSILSRAIAGGRTISAQHYQHSLDQTQYEVELIRKALMTDALPSNINSKVGPNTVKKDEAS